jgi:predicted DNA-binding protein (UPF0251 family)
LKGVKEEKNFALVAKNAPPCQRSDPPKRKIPFDDEHAAPGWFFLNICPKQLLTREDFSVYFEHKFIKKEGGHMPRPRKCRRVQNHPHHGFYKPQGVPIQDLRGVTLPVEGLEAIRLADADGMEHEEAARRMGVSRPTFSRILSEARRQVARALSNGWALRIEGGDYEVVEDLPPRGNQRRRGCGGGFRCPK